ncbi:MULTISPECIES: HAD family hydrolase [Moorena]|uniref:Haloacid dehalogenase n=1 Tax=Moorena bouillonii PNG TaxID=568701 RepID=A0A1U7N148_9CYAN|nr:MULTISPECIES: haloacid dehalogenase [Moorena]NEO12809.1 HAD family hydrolase [Moorena sp. SIO3E8]NEP99584.1 HAD family hydrolase [Moorena sp. SIO3F7]OLT59669.1 haloacid dehalogenase [Moorena bouillonii PNG]
MVPTILALDFDGVLCNGLLEYFQTAWRTYCQIWKPASETPPENLAASFYPLRPVIQIGWEMPILIHALILGISEDEILQNWSTVSQSIVNSETLDRTDIAKQLDTIRDKWITTDLDGWLSLHQFYPGVIERLDQILSTNTTQVYIVSTKEGRFIKQLLLQQGIKLPQDRIIGKESKRPKHQTLRQLIETFPGEAVTLWFVEDRLKTLKSVQQQQDLKPVKLYLADWGYNTKAEQESACNDPRIQLLSLEQFSQDFSNWLD